MGDAVVSRGNAGWTTLKSGHPCPCQSCSHGPLQKRLEENFCWIVPHVPPNDPISQGAELNWTVPLMMLLDRWALHLSVSLFSSWSGCWQYNVVGVVSARNLSGSRNKCSIKLDLCVFIFYPSSPPPPTSTMPLHRMIALWFISHTILVSSW